MQSLAMVAVILVASGCEKAPGTGKAAESGKGSGQVDGIGQQKPGPVIDAGDGIDAQVDSKPGRYPVRAVVNARGPQEEMPVVTVSGKPYRGPDCQVSYAPRPDRDNAPMCLQPGGEFLMGAAPGEGPPEPQQKVTLSPFLMDQFEVTRAQFAKFLNTADYGLQCDELGKRMCRGDRDAGFPWPLQISEDGKVMGRLDNFKSDKHSFAVRKGEARMPMNEVSVIAADAYCAWAGKMLPTNAQWEYAAAVEPLTGKLRKFPWGDVFDKRAVRCGFRLCADGKNEWASVDAFPKDQSATGVRGMAAGVTEYVRDCVEPSISLCGECKDPQPAGPCKTKRGVDSFIAEGNATRGGERNVRSEKVFRTTFRNALSFGVVLDQGFRCVTHRVTASE